jgi:hypothetical protein
MTKPNQYNRLKRAIKKIILQEMIYDGNVGITELMAFYAKAPESLVANVQKLLDSEDPEYQKSAWRIIRKFTAGQLNESELANLTEANWKSFVAGGMLGATAALSPLSSKAVTNPPTATTSGKSKQAENAITHQDQVVAATMIGEAGGENIRGLQAILNVIMNRAKGNYKDTLKVVLKPRQFAFWDGRHNKVNQTIREVMVHPRWKDALALILKAKEGTLPDITHGADFYHAKKIKNLPDWANAFNKTAHIGNQVFYNHGNQHVANFV